MLVNLESFEETLVNKGSRNRQRHNSYIAKLLSDSPSPNSYYSILTKTIIERRPRCIGTDRSRLKY